MDQHLAQPPTTHSIFPTTGANPAKPRELCADYRRGACTRPDLGRRVLSSASAVPLDLMVSAHSNQVEWHAGSHTMCPQDWIKTTSLPTQTEGFSPLCFGKSVGSNGGRGLRPNSLPRRSRVHLRAAASVNSVHQMRERRPCSTQVSAVVVLVLQALQTQLRQKVLENAERRCSKMESHLCCFSPMLCFRGDWSETISILLPVQEVP